MNSREPCDLNINEAARAIADRDLSVLALTKSCLRRIDALEDKIQAWAHVNRTGAIEAAERLDLELKEGNNRGPLHGIPVGIKDIFQVVGQPTKAGSRFLEMHPAEDATAVARLREAGAIILGKTHTTEFAYFHPAVTRNPWNLEHTPGGSSSGSAAGVAAGMCLAALGTQTLGSVLRPAAFTGLVGFKPQYGRVSTYGVIPLSRSLDHVGVIARNVEDAGIVFRTIAGYDPNDVRSLEELVPDYRDPVLADYTPKIGFIKGFFFDNADEEMQEHTLKAVEALCQAGFHIDELLPEIDFQELAATGNTIMAVEAAAYHKDMFEKYADTYGDETKALIRRGIDCPATEYADAVDSLLWNRRKTSQLFEEVDIILTPGATGAAPRGLVSTGSPVIHAPWTILGMPSISLPMGLNKDGLPLAIQLTGPAFAEDHLLATALQCEKVFGFFLRPPITEIDKR